MREICPFYFSLKGKDKSYHPVCGVDLKDKDTAVDGSSCPSLGNIEGCKYKNIHEIIYIANEGI